MAVDATSMSMTTIWYSMATTGSLELVPRASAAPRPRPGEERRHLELKSNLFELDPLGPRRGGSLEVSDQGIPVDDLHPPTSSSPSRAGRQDDRAGFREIDPCPQSKPRRSGWSATGRYAVPKSQSRLKIMAKFWPLLPWRRRSWCQTWKRGELISLVKAPHSKLRLEWLRWPIGVPITASKRMTCPSMPRTTRGR